MKEDKRNYQEQWLEKTEHDLLASRLILDHQPHELWARKF